LTVFRQNREKVLRIAPDHFINSTLAPGAYGHIAVMQLEDFGRQIEDIATAYATHFRVTGKTTSLLMLESEEDYQRFNIRPEANAFVVKTQPVSEVVARVLAKIGDALGDPKAAFKLWLEKIEKLPHLRFETSTAFRLALDQMPAEYFQVTARPLDIKHRRWQGVPAKVKKQLSSQKLEYDTITREAQRRNKKYGPADALRVLSSLVENSPGDSVVARDVAYSASAYGLHGHAYHLYRRVAAVRPYEPQTYRAMAQVLELLGKTDLALVYYEVGLRGNWDPRFGEFRRIHGIDYLRFLKKVNSGKLHSSVPDYARLRYDTLQQKLDLKQTDLLIAITWNTDRTDVDLHVVEPSGEECYYKNRKTRSGGSLTQDVTQGYGPEMYILQNAKNGAYKIRVKYFSQDASRASTRTKVAVTVIEGWGTQQERTTRKTVTLNYGKQMHDLMTVTFSK
jgi:tetratricopeptide (TPR) repeat protein